MPSLVDRARALEPELLRWRRSIHAHPELGYREHRTADLVADAVGPLCRSVQRGVARTGVVAELVGRGGAQGPVVVLRADMDALPITEASGLPFASTAPGVCHACGHDAHVAMLLGAAHLLSEEHFSGVVRLVFQPAEENCYDDPAGWSGGRRMVAEGVLDGAAAAVALHQIPELPLGWLCLRPGPVMACAEFFEVRVRGRASHAGASPHRGVDAVLLAAEIIVALQAIVSREVDARETAVLSVTMVRGGHAPNILADSVDLRGTIRSLDDTVQAHLRRRLSDTATALAALRGGSAEVTFEQAYPATRNDPGVVETVRRAAEQVFGDGVRDLGPSMGGEDFSFFCEQVPSCFALLGTRTRGVDPRPLHHPAMTLDEGALPLGAAFLAGAALELLRSPPPPR